MHTPTSESDFTSNAPLSSPKPYYVESPSPGDTTDDKYCSSTNSRSLPDSPFFPSSASSASTAASHVSGNRRRWNNKHYHNVADDEERGGDFGVDYTNLSRSLSFVFAFGLAFAALCFVLWIASRPYKIQVKVKSLKLHNLRFGEGSDRTGVPTKFITVNSSVRMFIYNPATFFGVQVSFHAANLLFYQIKVATGQVGKYYQPKKSGRDTWMRMEGRGIPLYGSGVMLKANNSCGIPLVLELVMQTRGYVVGKLVQTQHTRHVLCSLLINSERTENIIFSHNSCSYV